MFRFACALLALGLANAGQQCFQGDLTVGDHSIPQDALLEMAGHSASDQAAAVMKSNEGFRKFMESRQTCQHQCFGNVFHTSFKTLIANLGNDLFKDSSQDLAVEALTGAFLACYPNPSRDQVQDIVTSIVKNMGKPAEGVEMVADGGACTGPEGAKKGDRADFMEMFKTKFPEALHEVFEANPEIEKELGMKKDCQADCVQQTLLAAVRNLWDSGLITAPDTDDVVNKALTGAAKACFPRIPHDDMKMLITEILKVLDGSTQTTRLYQDKQISAIATTYAPIVGLGAAGLITVFWAGLVAGKRMRHGGREASLALITSDEDIQ